MAVTGSLQLSHELGICRHYGHTKKHKTVVGKGRVHLLSLPLSSYTSRQDVWSLHLSDTIHKPIHSISSSCNVFLCRSFFIPGQANETPILKTAALALKRSYNTLHGSPLVLQLVPAAAVVAFALLGLGPLMRHSRNVILRRNDNSWKKSRTYYVLTSYLRPLLLWTGATLACRVLDPVILPSAASQAVKNRLLNFVRSLSTVLAFAYCLSSVIQQAQKFFMETNDSSDTRNMGFQFAGKSVYTAVWVAAVSLFMELLGFSTQKWVTAGGLGTVLLTLAGREIFTNFLSSVMIHATRPFVVNEWIQTKIEGYEVSGTVEHVGWWSPTIIRGDDREAVHIPNHKFTVNVVRNLSQKTHWRIKTHLAISHLDVNKINNIVADMRKVLAKNPQVEHKRLHRRVFLENIDPENQALLILISCFVKTSRCEEYLCVKEAILLDLLRVISHHRARLATPIRTVQKIYGDADVENIPFAETIFSRNGTATHHRPFLLIEPPPRINGDDKTKTRPTRTTEEQEPKPAATTDPKLKDPVSDASQQNGSDKKQQQKKSGKVDGSPTTSPSKLQLEGSDSMGLNSKDNTLLGAAFEKTPITLSDSIKEKTDAAPPAATNTDDTPPMAKKTDATPMAKKTDTTPSMAKKADATPMAKKTDATPMTTTSHAKHESERLVAPPTVVSRPALEENIVLGVALEGSKRTLPIEEEMAPSVSCAEPKELAACRNGNGSSSSGKDKKYGAQIPVGDMREQER